MMLEAALDYAARGWHVFPVNSAKEPLVERGLNAATTDEAQIRAWWTAMPNAAIGVRTGAISGIAILDLDMKGEDIATIIADVEAIGGPIPKTAVSITGGGGRHYLFKVAPGTTIKNSTGAIRKRVDVRGEGGYFVAPPSMHASGKRYEWQADIEPADGAWLAALIEKTAPRRQRVKKATAEGLGDTSWVREALTFIDADCGYDKWFRICKALTLLGDAGWPLFLEWSASAPQVFDENACGKQWSACASSPAPADGGIGLGTIAKAARDGGWRGDTGTAAPAASPSTDAQGDTPYIEDNNRLYRVDSKGKRYLVSSPPFYVIDRVIEVVDGTESLKVAWESDGRRKEAVHARDTLLNAKNITSLLNTGFPVSSTTAAEAVAYIQHEELSLIEECRHSRTARVLGYHGKGFLYGNEKFGDAPDFQAADETSRALVANIHTRGSMAAWSRHIAPFMVEYPILRTCLAAAVSSPLLRHLGPTARPFIIDLAGETGVGKSQMMQIAMSAIGDPLHMNTTFEDTAIALGTYTALFADHTVAIDESKKWKGKRETLAPLIYSLMGDRGRGRGLPQVGRMQKAERYASVLITTSEYPLKSVTGDGGLRSRCMTIHTHPWKEQSPAAALAVNSCLSGVMKNYGHACRLIVESIMGWDEAAAESVRETWALWKEHYMDAAAATNSNHKIAPRQSEYAATLALAGSILHGLMVQAAPELANDAAFMAIETDMLPASLWTMMLDESEDADRPESAMKTILSLTAQEPDRFTTFGAADSGLSPHGGFYGGITIEASEIKELALFPQAMRDLLKRFGYDVDTIITAWAKRGWLKMDGKRADRKVTIGGRRVRAYCLAPEAFAIAQTATLPGEEEEAPRPSTPKDTWRGNGIFGGRA